MVIIVHNVQHLPKQLTSQCQRPVVWGPEEVLLLKPLLFKAAAHTQVSNIYSLTPQHDMFTTLIMGLMMVWGRHRAEGTFSCSRSFGLLLDFCLWVTLLRSWLRNHILYAVFYPVYHPVSHTNTHTCTVCSNITHMQPGKLFSVSLGVRTCLCFCYRQISVPDNSYRDTGKPVTRTLRLIKSIYFVCCILW